MYTKTISLESLWKAFQNFEYYSKILKASQLQDMFWAAWRQTSREGTVLGLAVLGIGRNGGGGGFATNFTGFVYGNVNIHDVRSSVRLVNDLSR